YDQSEDHLSGSGKGCVHWASSMRLSRHLNRSLHRVSCRDLRLDSDAVEPGRYLVDLKESSSIPRPGHGRLKRIDGQSRKASASGKYHILATTDCRNVVSLGWTLPSSPNAFWLVLDHREPSYLCLRILVFDESDFGLVCGKRVRRSGCCDVLLKRFESLLQFLGD